MTEQITAKAFTFSHAKDYLTAKLAARNLTYPPVILPLYNDQAAKSPGPFVFLAVGGGPGLSLEAVFDRVFIGLRVVSRSNDFDGGEALALSVHEDFCAFASSGALGDLWGLSIVPAGGRPQVLMQDNAERYHFTASYITEVESGF